MRRRVFQSTHELAVTALEFRRALEKSSVRRHSKVMSRFPLGCCKHSSQLLAKYLVTELHVPLVSFVYGERGGGGTGEPWQSHVWLRVGEHTLDITADQYPEVDAPVVVSVGGGWHSAWHRQRHLTFGEMMTFGFWDGVRFGRMYKAVMRAMDYTPPPRVVFPLRNAGPPAEPA